MSTPIKSKTPITIPAATCTANLNISTIPFQVEERNPMIEPQTSDVFAEIAFQAPTTDSLTNPQTSIAFALIASQFFQMAIPAATRAVTAAITIHTGADIAQRAAITYGMATVLMYVHATVSAAHPACIAGITNQSPAIAVTRPASAPASMITPETICGFSFANCVSAIITGVTAV